MRLTEPVFTNFRKHYGWLIGLSAVAIWLLWGIGNDNTNYKKRFTQATALANGYIVESDPGGDSGDPSEQAFSAYHFQVAGITYEGDVKDELPRGQVISIRYNPVDPSFNHAQNDSATLYDKEKAGLLCLAVVFVLIISLLWEMRAPSQEEPEIDLGDYSLESIRQAAIKRLGRDLKPKEEAKIRRIAERVRGATEQERTATQKFGNALRNAVDESRAKYDSGSEGRARRD